VSPHGYSEVGRKRVRHARRGEAMLCMDTGFFAYPQRLSHRGPGTLTQAGAASVWIVRGVRHPRPASCCHQSERLRTGSPHDDKTRPVLACVLGARIKFVRVGHLTLSSSGLSRGPIFQLAPALVFGANPCRKNVRGGEFALLLKLRVCSSMGPRDKPEDDNWGRVPRQRRDRDDNAVVDRGRFSPARATCGHHVLARSLQAFPLGSERT